LKVGIVGTGFVGATAGYALLTRGTASDLVFIDRDEKRALGEAMDVLHAAPFSHPVRVRAGDFADLRDARIVIVAAGANQKPGETRLDLVQKNAAVIRDVVPQIVRHAPDTILLMATNPVDVLTHVAWESSGLPPTRVIGSGTTLDTARLRALVGQRATVSPKNVHGYVLGEHGDSEVVAWSTVMIAGLMVADFFEQRGMEWSVAIESEISAQVRGAAYRIIEGKGATYYGVASALAHVCRVIGSDQNAVLTVAQSDGEVAYSLPRILAASGVVATLDVRLSDQEHRDLTSSAQLIRARIRDLADPRP
jgi:L-lactate dehydrogenase